jgi:type I restriction enzyme S subunit
MPRANMDAVLELPILAPPLGEQHRIVALLDEAFAGIAIAKANAEKSLRNARGVSESISQQVLDSAGGDDVSLESVAADDCSLSYGIVQPGNDVEGGLPVVRPVDLTRNVITLDGLKRIDPELALGYERTKLQGGELLLCVRGTTGTVSIAAPELEGGNVTRGIVPIRFKSDRVIPSFGYHLIKSGGVQSQIRERTYGAALMQINIGDLRNIKVKIPPLSEQNELAERLDNLRKGAAHLQSLYTRKLAALDELKQSLLQRAFSGQL